ncbi:MAG: hypothetical protein WAL56_22770 [Candidatus Sulfotelmatobacter sp.]
MTDSKSLADDMKLLREEHRRLSASILRFTSLRLLALFLFTFTFGSALGKIQSLDSGDIVAAHDQLVSDVQTLHGGLIDFRSAPFIWGSCPTRVGDFAVVKGTNNQIGLSADDYEKIEPLVQNLCRLYGKAFSAPVEVIGLKLELDLRRWAYILPIAYWLSAVYLCLLRKKLKVVAALARHRAQANPQGPVSTLDAMLFLNGGRRGTTYSRLPMEFLAPFYSLLMFGFFLYLGMSFAPFLNIIASETDAFWPLSHGILILLTCTVVYISHTSASLESQICQTVGCVPDELTSRWTMAMRSVFSWFRRHSLFPRWRSFSKSYLLSGSLLLLVTLDMATTVGSCGDSHTGYELARNKVPWLGTEMFAHPTKLVSGINQALGVGTYVAALLLAIVSLIILLVSMRRRFNVLSNRHLVGAAFALSTTIASFLLSQLSFVLTMGSGSPGASILGWLWVPYWIGCTFVWGRFARTAMKLNQLRWPSRSWLILLYLPQVASLLTLTLSLILPDPKMFGLLAYFIGIHLLALAYALLLARQCPHSDSSNREEDISRLTPVLHPSPSLATLNDPT